MAWFSATPSGDTKSRLEAYKKADGDYEIPLPDIREAKYLVGLLYDAGTVCQSGQGISPLSWVEIDSWLKVTQLSLSNWELITIKNMSHAYASEYSRASEKSALMPYTNVEVGEVDRAAVNAKAMSIFAGMKKKQKE